jgi:hypothetical protein
MAKATASPKPPSDADLRGELAPILRELAELVLIKKIQAERLRAFGLALQALDLIGHRMLSREIAPALMSRALTHEPALSADQAVQSIAAYLDGPVVAGGFVPGNLIKWLTHLALELLLAS